VEEDQEEEEGSLLKTGGLREINGSLTFQQTGYCSISYIPLLLSIFLYEPMKDCEQRGKSSYKHS